MSSRTHIARGLLACTGLLLLAGLAATVQTARVTHAQSIGGLSVQVVNGTPGGTLSAIPLSLYMVDGEKTEVVKEGKTDASGKLSWPDLTGPLSARYVISTTYQGVVYTTEPVALPAPAVSLRVYEITGDDKELKIANAGMVILQVDAETQIIRLLETLTLHNSGNRTFVPSADGPRGPMGLLRFGLPEGAGNLTANGRLGASAIIQVNTGFATDMPVPPGDTDATYTYEIAYGALSEGGYTKLNKSFPYPVDILSLLVSQGDFSVQTPQLVEKETAVVGARQYRQWKGTNLPAHTELTLELRNLPLVLPVLRPGSLALQVVVGILVLAAVAFPVIYARRLMRESTTYAGDGEGVVSPSVSSRNVRQAHPLRVRKVERVQPPAEKESQA